MSFKGEEKWEYPPYSWLVKLNIVKVFISYPTNVISIIYIIPNENFIGGMGYLFYIH